MSDILVLNTGSSSIKFSIFMIGGDECNLNFTLRGEIEGIGAEHARFRAASAAGHVVLEKALSGPDTHLNHNQALIAPNRLSRRPSRCHETSPKAAFTAMASMDSHTNTSRAFYRNF
jgi:hypothetical protein